METLSSLLFGEATPIEIAPVLKDGGSDNSLCHEVGITVTGGPPVFKISLTIWGGGGGGGGGGEREGGERGRRYGGGGGGGRERMFSDYPPPPPPP